MGAAISLVVFLEAGSDKALLVVHVLTSQRLGRCAAKGLHALPKSSSSFGKAGPDRSSGACLTNENPGSAFGETACLPGRRLLQA